jgi:hypothetical protein
MTGRYPYPTMPNKVVILAMTLPVEQQSEPFIGWKIGRVIYSRPYWDIQPMNFNTDDIFITSSDKAVCLRVVNAHPSDDNNIPSENCSCGFYAVKTHRGLSPDSWLMKVRLYGRVIEYTEGYRAEKQNILEIWPPDNFYDPYMNQLPTEYPDIIWHLPEPKLESLVKDATPQTAIVFDSMYDTLPRELVDQLMPNGYMHMFLPFLKNQSIGLQAIFRTNNNGITLEIHNYDGSRIFGPILFSGSRYHWYGPDGKPLPR